MGSEPGARESGAPMPLRRDPISDADAASMTVYFLHELEVRLEALQRAWTARSLGEIRTIARQLKGAAGGYGHPEITREAAALERTLLGEAAIASEIGEKLEDLIATCRQVCPAGSDET